MSRVGIRSGVRVGERGNLLDLDPADQTDFNARAATTGVVLSTNMNDQIETLSHRHESGRTNAWDSTVKASGNGSIRLDLVGGQVGDPLLENPAGSFKWFTPLSYGANSELWIQYRQRWDQQWLDYCDSSSFTGGGHKSIIITRDDGTSNVPLQVVLNNYNYNKTPNMFTAIGAGFIDYVEAYPTGFFVQGQKGLFCVKGGGGFTQDLTDCAIFHADEWMTFQIHLVIGPHGTDGDSSLQPRFDPATGYINSEIELYVAREGERSQLVTRQTNVVLRTVDLDEYGSFYLNTFDTGATSNPPITVSTWFDELIVGTQRIPDPGFTDASTTVLGIAAESLSAGDWVQLSEDSSLAALGLPTCRFFFQESGVWDPIRKRVVCLSECQGGTEDDMYKLVYDEATNTWSNGLTIAGAVGHGYDCLTVDPATGDLYMYYSLSAGTGGIKKSTDGAATWSDILAPPWTATNFGMSLSWFPEINDGAGGLIFVGTTNNTFWFDGVSWTKLTLPTNLGSFSPFSEYNHITKTVWFGGGSGATDIHYKLDRALTITQLSTPPVNLISGSSGGSHMSTDPVSGKHISYDATTWRQFDIEEDVWSTISMTGAPTGWTFASKQFHVVLPDHGCIMWYLDNITIPTRPDIWLYKHEDD